MKDFIGGVILYDETINQTSSSKQTIPELISNLEQFLELKLIQVQKF